MRGFDFWDYINITMKIKKHVRRFDLGEIRSATRTPQGFLMCPGFATRVGVFPYLNADGSVRNELRHPDDVFDPASLETLKYAPVTIEHPPEMITPKNVGKYGKGHTTERVEVNRNMIDVDLIVENEEAIRAIEDQGIRELSCGYAADVVDESGVYNGAPYDCRQKNIKYNHLALVKRGRAGPEIRLRLDSSDAIMQDLPKPAENTFSQESSVVDADIPGENGTKKVIILGREVDLPSDIAEAIQDYKDRFDEMRAKLSQMEESMGKRNDNKDVDINQPGVSPQVKVEQQTPDGRGASGKTPAKPGTITGGPSAKADDEEMDEDEKGIIGGSKSNSKEEGAKELADNESEEMDDAEEGKGEGGAEDPLNKLKKDWDEAKKKVDEEFKGKMDEFAAASMNQPEKKEDGMSKEEIQKMIRARAKLERQAEKLVPFTVSKRFDSMTDKEILASVIKHRHPKADLEGKSKTYLQSRFDSITESLSEEGTVDRQRAGRELLGLGGGRFDSKETNEADPTQARLKMLSESKELYKQPLSASKKLN